MESIEDMNALEEANHVSYMALEEAKRLVKAGASMLDIAESLEKYIKEQGLGLAFPVNISVDNEAAHDTPEIGDERAFEGNVVKIDLGAEKNGMLGDCAVTIDLSNQYGKLLEASKAALDDAIATIKAGIEVREVGKRINDAITKRGFVPIYNLGGHQIEKNKLHAGLFLPNYDNGDSTKLEEGMTVAIEPFATTGKGRVTEGDYCQIYSYIQSSRVRSSGARGVLEMIEKSYSKNPFAARWLGSKEDKFSVQAGLRELYNANAIEAYPTLVEVSKGIVAQFEASVVVEKDSCKVLTK